MGKKLVLQPRLRAIAELVPAGRPVADVGTDHGYIPVFLLLNEKVPFAIASDIGEEPLAHARRTAAQYGVTEGLDFRLCDGLTGICSEEADTVVIAGMGGDNIASILAAAPWTTRGKTLLLQPMSKAEVLRAWLPGNGYRVMDERLVADKGVIYPILTVEGGEMEEASFARCHGGFCLETDPLWGAYLAERILRLRRAVSGLEKARSGEEELLRKRKEMLAGIGELERWKGEWDRGSGK